MQSYVKNLTRKISKISKIRKVAGPGLRRGQKKSCKTFLGPRWEQNLYDSYSCTSVKKARSPRLSPFENSQIALG